MMTKGAVIQPGSLDGRVALVTGGGSGIGLAIALRFAGLGADVALLGRRLSMLDEARAQIEALGRRALSIVADVRDDVAVSTGVQTVRDFLGGLDILVNNAAGTFVVPTAELSPKGWRTVVDIDLNGTFYCCHAAYEALAASRFGGRIINIVTDKGRTGWPKCAHTAAAKAGIVSLTRTLAQEWGPDGIRSNTVAPGPIEGTEGVSRLYEQQNRAAQELSTIPLGRFGQTSDIAEACAFLASEAGAFINGTDLVIDGGRAWHTPTLKDTAA